MRPSDGWARVLPGIPPNCGVVRFRFQLGSQDGGYVYSIGVIPAANTHPFTYDRFDAFSNGCNVWFIQNDAIFCNGENVEDYFSPNCMDSGDIVSVEVQRWAKESVLRLKVDGRPAKEARVPNAGELYLVVRPQNAEQSYTLLPLP